MYLITLCIILARTAFAIEPITIEPLPDGVSVRGGETLKVIDAAWHIYVTLDPPVPPETIVQRVLDLEHTVKTLEKFYGSAIKLDSQYFKRTVLLNKLHVVPTDT